MPNKVRRDLARPIQRLIIVVTCSIAGVGLVGTGWLALADNPLAAILMFTTTAIASVRMSILGIFTFKKGSLHLGRPRGRDSVKMNTSGIRKKFRDELAIAKVSGRKKP